MIKFFYICGVAWQHELGEIPVLVYDSIERLKKMNSCWKECGIVELKVEFVEWIEPQDLTKVKTVEEQVDLLRQKRVRQNDKYSLYRLNRVLK